MALLRTHALPAVLLWELCCSIRTRPGETDEADPFAGRLRRGGFRSTTDQLADLVAPVVPGWTLKLRGSTLVLTDPWDHRDEFHEATDTVPRTWLEALSGTGRYLVVYGDGFGLERPDPERFDRVCQRGDALAALVPFSKE